MIILIVNVLMTNQPKEWNSVGYVLWHNGKIFCHTVPRKEISADYFSAEVETSKQNGYNEYEAQLEAMKKLSKSCGLSLEEI